MTGWRPNVFALSIHLNGLKSQLKVKISYEIMKYKFCWHWDTPKIIFFGKVVNEMRATGRPGNKNQKEKEPDFSITWGGIKLFHETKKGGIKECGSLKTSVYQVCVPNKMT